VLVKIPLAIVGATCFFPTPSTRRSFAWPRASDCYGDPIPAPVRRHVFLESGIGDQPSEGWTSTFFKENKVADQRALLYLSRYCSHDDRADGAE